MSAFIVCPLGFENDVCDEVKKCWPYLLAKDSKPHALPLPDLQITKGGVALDISLHLAVQLNFFLKIATRVLWRLGVFKAKDFPKLHHKMNQLSWLEYLPQGSFVQIKVAAQKSRLNNEKRIASVLQDVLNEKGFQVVPSALEGVNSFLVAVRFFADECMVSLDLSGDALYKRGWATYKGSAPLRENLAVGLLHFLLQNQSYAFLKKVGLIDPFCGSGTFLIEAQKLQQPSFHRSFAFQKLKNAPKLFLSPTFYKNYKWDSKLEWGFLMGLDIDTQILNAFQKQWTPNELGYPQKIIHYDFWQKSSNDLLEKDINKNSLLQKWIIGNPPYGERLHWKNLDQENNKNVKNSLLEILERIEFLFEPHRIVLLTPVSWHLPAKPSFVKDFKTKSLQNGGLPVTAWFFELIRS